MKYLVIVLCLITSTVFAQTTQPTSQPTTPSTNESSTQQKFVDQLRSNKEKSMKEKEAANKAAEAEIRKTGKLPTTQAARKMTKEDTEPSLTEEEMMAKYGLAISDKNALGGPDDTKPAPNFKGVDQNGNTLELSQLLEKGEVVVFFYRGYWCGICNRQLANMESELKKLTDKGATVIAITTESNEFVQKTIEKNNINFSVISDKDGKIARDYNVLYEVSEDYQKKISSYTKSTIQKFNDSEEAFLPVPATYIIGQNGMITWKHYSIDYSKRPSVDEISEYLR